MIAGKQQLFFGVSDGETFRIDEDTFSDDGSAINLKVRTKDYYLSGPDVIDEIQRIFIYSDDPRGGNISISLNGGDYDYLGQAQETKAPERFDVWEKCYKISIGIDEISTNNVKFKGFNIIYEPQKEII